jgi:hypothetical protein
MRNRITGAGSEARLDVIEARLAGALRRVTPPHGLVQRLRERIRMPDRREIAGRLRDWQALLLVLGGVLSGALVLITFARALYHVVGRRHVG